MRRLMRELTELKKSPPEGIRVQTSDDNMLDVTGIIQGPGALSLAAVVHSRVGLTYAPRHRGYAVRWRLLQGQVPIHGGVPCCTTEMYVYHTYGLVFSE